MRLGFSGTRRPWVAQKCLTYFFECYFSPAVRDWSRMCLLPQGTQECWLCIPHLYNGACSMAHSGSQPVVIPAIWFCWHRLSGCYWLFGLVFWVQNCIFFWCSLGPMPLQQLLHRRAGGRAGLELLVGMLRDAQGCPAAALLTKAARLCHFVAD